MSFVYGVWAVSLAVMGGIFIISKKQALALECHTHKGRLRSEMRRCQTLNRGPY